MISIFIRIYFFARISGNKLLEDETQFLKKETGVKQFWSPSAVLKSGNLTPG
jgi:hypothetical protein